MHGIEFLQDLAVVMIVAGVVTVLFHRLRQPVVLGYIVAGALVGPNTPPFPLIHDEQSIHTLAELGVILLMFSLGLHFSLKQLVRVGPTAGLGAGLEIVLMGLLGFQTGRLFGWSNADAIFLGAILSMSSTTIIIKALTDLKLTKAKFADLVFGILIVEDVLAIALLALLPGIATSGTLAVGTATHTLGKLAVFLTVVLVAGLLIVPVLLRFVARFRSDEMMLVAALGLCFGVSLLAARLDYSVALGAFLIGAVIAETREAGRISTLVEPVKDMFAAIFFVAVGMLIDPRILWQYAVPILVITAVCVVGKVIACSAGTFLAGHEPKTSLRVGMAIAQIGEFSFIIAKLGADLKLTGPHLYPVTVAVSAVTTLLTPYLIRSSDPTVNWFERVAPASWMHSLNLYGQWFNRSNRQARASDQIRKLLRKWTLQIALNMTLVSGLFLAAAWLGQRMAPGHGAPADRPLRHYSPTPTIVWFAAALLALPLLIATVRKLRAAAMVLAELSVAKSAAGAQTATARKVIANTIVGAGCAGMLLWILALSAAILPPWYILIGLLAGVAGVAAMLWQSFVKLYAKAQIAIHETLATTHEHHAEPPEPVAPLPALLREAVLRTLLVSPGSPADGKLIRELALRTATGASVVGIERDGHPIINPGPDEELKAGDRVLLIGTDQQLAGATPLLSP